MLTASTTSPPRSRSSSTSTSKPSKRLRELFHEGANRPNALDSCPPRSPTPRQRQRTPRFRRNPHDRRPRRPHAHLHQVGVVDSSGIPGSLQPARHRCCAKLGSIHADRADARLGRVASVSPDGRLTPVFGRAVATALAPRRSSGSALEPVAARAYALGVGRAPRAPVETQPLTESRETPTTKQAFDRGLRLACTHRMIGCPERLDESPLEHPVAKPLASAAPRSTQSYACGRLGTHPSTASSRSEGLECRPTKCIGLRGRGNGLGNTDGSRYLCVHARYDREPRSAANDERHFAVITLDRPAQQAHRALLNPPGTQQSDLARLHACSSSKAAIVIFGR